MDVKLEAAVRQNRLVTMTKQWHRSVDGHLILISPLMEKFSYRCRTHLSINTMLDKLLPSVQQQSFLEWTPASFEQSLAEFYTTLLEEHLQVALEMLEVGICSSLQSPKLTTVVQ
jgi:hypothetical protein